MTFLALLAIAIGVLTALGLVLVGLVEMPWPLLLIALLVVLYGFQRLIEMNGAELPVANPSNFISAEPPLPSKPSPSPPATDQVSSDAPQGDVLIYRGVRAQPAATLEASSDKPPSNDELIYRGVRYRVDHPSQD